METVWRTAVWVAVASVAYAAGAHEIAFDNPAPDTLQGWEQESLPIGNGFFGVSVFGSPQRERLQVTEASVMTHRNLTSALDLRVDLPMGYGAWNGYRRALDLDTGVVTVDYVRNADGARMRHEYFTSYPDRTLVMRYTCSRPGGLEFRLYPEVPYLRPWGDRRDWVECYKGRMADYSATNGEVRVCERLQWHNIILRGAAKVVTDGTVRTLHHTLHVRGATTATVFFTCRTNYVSPEDTFREIVRENEGVLRDEDDPKDLVDTRLAAVAAKGYERVKADHLADFAGLMRRVRLDLPDKDDERFFQFGRYLLVSSSRPGTLPPSLQGVWTAHDDSPWGCGYWHNINIQMNYWPAFSCNLAECFEAYARWNAAVRRPLAKFAREYVAKTCPENLPEKGREPSDWWCIGTGNWPCRFAPSRAYRGHDGPGTGGLTTKLFKDWYDFTLDERVLRDHAWPVLHGMAEFLTRCVVETNGVWLSKFSASPEQQIRAADGSLGAYYHTTGCAFDQQMIHENNADTLALAEILGVEDDCTRTIRRQLGRYDPVIVGASGQVKEFREENEYGDIGERQHRHISQLVGLYPGSLINASTPDWLEAAKVSLTKRGDRSTGWALAHRLCCWARVRDGDHAHRLLKELLTHRTAKNLWDEHPPFQIDGNFGATAGIAEMLLQSQAGFIDLLPALPQAWAKEGSFRGLCARGAFVVDCEWRDGRPVKVSVVSRKGRKPDVRFAGRPFPFELRK